MSRKTAEDLLASQETQEPLYESDFSDEGTAIDPLDPDNRCFEIGRPKIPVEQLPKGKRLVLKMRVYCEVFGSPPDRDPAGPAQLQLDVISKVGSRRISQCRFPVGKGWVAAEMRFTVFESTDSVVIYNKWTRDPIFVDNVSIRLELGGE